VVESRSDADARCKMLLFSVLAAVKRFNCDTFPNRGLACQGRLICTLPNSGLDDITNLGHLALLLTAVYS